MAAASKGLGFGVAQALVNEGVKVAICGRDAETIGAAARKLGSAATPIVADVSSPAGADGFMRERSPGLDGIDILVANAGGPPPGNFASVTVDQYLDAFELNCRSTIAMCYEAVPEMRAAVGPGGRDHVDRGAPADRDAHPLEHRPRRAHRFLKTLAREIASDGVTVNSLLPGLRDRAHRGAARRWR